MSISDLSLMSIHRQNVSFVFRTSRNICNGPVSRRVDAMSAIEFDSNNPEINKTMNTIFRIGGRISGMGDKGTPTPFRHVGTFLFDYALYFTESKS